MATSCSDLRSVASGDPINRSSNSDFAFRTHSAKMLRVCLIAVAISLPGRLTPALAQAGGEMHSTADPHHTSIAESFTASACSLRVDSSATSSGTIAEASQNFTGCPTARQGAPPPLKRRAWDAAAER